MYNYKTSNGRYNELEHFPFLQRRTVMSYALPNGKAYDLVSILQLYKTKHGSLEGRGYIDCPLTGEQYLICPEAISPADVTVTSLNGETFADDTVLPADCDIIFAVFRICDDEVCARYIRSTDVATLSIEDTMGATPAHCAAGYGRAEALRALFDKNQALLDAADQDGRTPAHYAAEYRRRAVLIALLDIRPELIDKEDPEGITPLYLAASNDFTTTSEVLLAHSAAEFGHTEVLMELCKFKTEFLGATDVRGRTPAHYAAGRGQIKTLIALLKERPGLLVAADLDGNTPAYLAVACGLSKTLTSLSEKCADLSVKTKALVNRLPLIRYGVAVVIAFSGIAALSFLILNLSVPITVCFSMAAAIAVTFIGDAMSKKNTHANFLDDSKNHFRCS